MYETLYQGKDDIYYTHSRPELLKFIPSGANDFLDIGCGTGNFGQMLKLKLFANVWGVEPDVSSAKQAAEKIDFVINDIFTLESVKVIDKQFDVITFNDVLEHLIDPEEALLNCKTLLKPGGVIIASIPNIRYHAVLNELIFQEDFRYQNSGPLDKTHLRFFTKKSILRMFDGTGYTVNVIEGINSQPIKGMKIKLLKLITGNYLADINFLQYAVVASLF